MADLRNKGQYPLPVETEFEYLSDRIERLEALFDEDNTLIELSTTGGTGVIDVAHGDVSFGTNDSAGTATAQHTSTFTLTDENGLHPTDIREITLIVHGPWVVLGTASTWNMSAQLTSPTVVTFEKKKQNGADGSDLPSAHYYTVAWVRRIGS